MAHEKPGQTLQATDLVHEAYVRLVDARKARHGDSRGHFFAAAEQQPETPPEEEIQPSPQRGR